jgi:hypothetical protein
MKPPINVVLVLRQLYTSSITVLHIIIILSTQKTTLQKPSNKNVLNYVEQYGRNGTIQTVAYSVDIRKRDCSRCRYHSHRR